MFDKDRIIYQLERTRTLTMQMLERIPHEQWYEMPVGVTHVAWNAGHIAVAEYFLGLVFIRGAKESDKDFIPESYIQLFGYGSEVSDDQSLYPEPNEILNIMGSVHDILLTETRSLPEDVLNDRCEFLEGTFDHHPIFEKKGGALEWLAYHEHVHIGTIGLLRRELGANPIDYFTESRQGKRFI